MKEILYAGKEEGPYVFGTFFTHMARVGTPEFDFLTTGTSENLNITGSWTIGPEHNSLRVDYLLRQHDPEGPVTVLATGSRTQIDRIKGHLGTVADQPA